MSHSSCHLELSPGFLNRVVQTSDSRHTVTFAALASPPALREVALSLARIATSLVDPPSHTSPGQINTGMRYFEIIGESDLVSSNVKVKKAQTAAQMIKRNDRLGKIQQDIRDEQRKSSMRLNKLRAKAQDL